MSNSLIPMHNHKGAIATLLTLGLVLVGTLITLGTSFFVNNKNTNLASNSRAQTADTIQKCQGATFMAMGNANMSGSGCAPACGGEENCQACTLGGETRYECTNTNGIPACTKARTYSSLTNCQNENTETDPNNCTQCLLLGFTPRFEYGGTGPVPSGGGLDCDYFTKEYCINDCLSKKCSSDGCGEVNGKQTYKCVPFIVGDKFCSDDKKKVMIYRISGIKILKDCSMRNTGGVDNVCDIRVSVVDCYPPDEGIDYGIINKPCKNLKKEENGWVGSCDIDLTCDQRTGVCIKPERVVIIGASIAPTLTPIPISSPEPMTDKQNDAQCTRELHTTYAYCSIGFFCGRADITDGQYIYYVKTDKLCGSMGNCCIRGDLDKSGSIRNLVQPTSIPIDYKDRDKICKTAFNTEHAYCGHGTGCVSRETIDNKLYEYVRFSYKCDISRHCCIIKDFAEEVKNSSVSTVYFDLATNQCLITMDNGIVYSLDDSSEEICQK